MTLSLPDQIQNLYQRFGSLSGISIEVHKELAAIQVDNKAASATVFLQGAQVTHYQPTGQESIIWLSDECDFRSGKPLRGGIPICWPWFGGLDENPMELVEQIDNRELAAAHGCVRSESWAVDSVDLLDDYNTRIILSLDISNNSHSNWPFASALKVTINIGKTLGIELSVKNTDQRTFSFTSALHSYFTVGDVEQVEIQGLDTCRFVDMLKGWESDIQTGNLVVSGELDRMYPKAPQCVEVLDRSLNRKLIVSSQNFPGLVVWNPWIEKSKRLTDFNDSAYRNMLCLENANVQEYLKQLAPGQTISMAIDISTTDL